MDINLKISDVINSVVFNARKNASTIYSVAAVGGVILTEIFSARAGAKTKESVQKEPDISSLTRAERAAVYIKHGWKYFILPTALAIGTSSCVIRSDIINKKHQAAIISSYLALKSHFHEYKSKVVRDYGVKEDERLEAEIIKDKILEEHGVDELSTPLNENDEIMSFWEPNRNDYIEITLADFYYALAKLNKNLMFDEVATLNEFYLLLGASEIPGGDNIGWSNTWFVDGFWQNPWIDVTLEDSVLDDGFKYKTIKYEPNCQPTEDAIKQYLAMFPNDNYYRKIYGPYYDKERKG